MTKKIEVVGRKRIEKARLVAAIRLRRRRHGDDDLDPVRDGFREAKEFSDSFAKGLEKLPSA